jgi:hypothetical protein
VGHHDSRPLLNSSPDDRPSSLDEHSTITSDFEALPEGRNYETDPAGASSSRSSRTPGGIIEGVGSKAATKPEEQVYELKERMKSFPRDDEGNYLPIHAI